jgi:uncharacterized caspase-like protein
MFGTASKLDYDQCMNRLLKAFTASIFLLCESAFAQDLLEERVALVVGNSAYTQALQLKNPVNDADAMDALLKKAGFRVIRQANASQESLRSSIKEFGTALRSPKVKFGIFYYAGHGVQLDWRNYLIPVDAKIESPSDIQKQAVDVSELFQYMQKTNNKSFLVVLDACRDDPFAGGYRPPSKGLSQFNAPVGSLIAFSTAPGDVALDGEGLNGLYTSHLLREFSVQNARLEDAFKRVRLNVRLESGGKQIPWESTSLEEDLYLFPNAKSKLSDSEREALFDKEVKDWGRVKVTNDLKVLVDFIREFPSGVTSELAQAKLNRILIAQAQERVKAEAQRQALEEQKANELAKLKAQQEKELLAQAEALQDELQAQLRKAQELADAAKAAEKETAKEQALLAAQALEAQKQEAIRIAQQQEQSRREELLRLEKLKLAQEERERASLAAAKPPSVQQTPNYAGLNVFYRNYSEGDLIEYKVIDSFNKSSKPLLMKVTQVDKENDRVVFNDGEYVSDLMGNIAKNVRGSMDAPRQFYPSEMYVGKKWRTQFKQSRPNGVVYTFYYDMKVVAKESITVQAGTFEAYKLEGRGFNVNLGASLLRRIWVAPGINADIAHETEVRLRNGLIDQADRQELVRYQSKEQRKVL